MPKLRTLYSLSLALAVCAATSATPQKQPITPDKNTIAQLEESIPRLMQEATVPAVSIAVIRDGQTYWLHTFGVANTKTKQPANDDTVFEAASLSKPVFTYAVLKLVDQGKLDLDAPLSKYLSKPYIEDDPRINQITARIVLSHRTGFRNWRNKEPLKIYFTPGERFSYSGEGFVYLSKVVEEITGKPLNDFLTETVFVPLGMTSSSYLWRPDYETRAATGHTEAGAPVDKFKPKEVNAAASLHTTAGDYGRFVDAVLTGTGLKPQTLKQLETPQIAIDPQCTNCTDRTPGELSKFIFWGLGWGIEKTPTGETIWHWGDDGTFKCFVAADIKRKNAVVYFANGENGLAIAQPIVEEAIGGYHPAFDWIKYDRYDSPSIKFAKEVREKGPAVAIPEYSAALHNGDISEQSINSLGYGLMGDKKLDAAIQIFQLNVELHPKSGNVYDSLGEGYMNDKQNELAIKNYEKSLEIDPKNSNASEMLKKLRAQ
jgi:CubicO group peptidase (beta-lactamase class C family)